ncbi:MULTISPECIES: hypothetical protein [unclassified Caballeronia]|uniref:hypothetical protein n=1 Tax=unclassified Caballeronia TaxID=2646786 RepID=UPI0028664DCD|nr:MULTISPECIES: hypothetical protein [unclassified Caballeronia]MDR5777523.1 hypothetical protein [Caballeronia sp. LZ002]MDR5852971.1 hypothetical protein [Caballeronia sp. LZ003]
MKSEWERSSERVQHAIELQLRQIEQLRRWPRSLLVVGCLAAMTASAALLFLLQRFF